MRNINFLSIIVIFLIFSCKPSENKVSTVDSVAYWGDNPWSEIRKKRIKYINMRRDHSKDMKSIENIRDAFLEHIVIYFKSGFNFLA